MMKLTPEQEAFYELGAARAFLFNKIEEARDYARRIYGESYCELTPKERADCWKHSEIKFFIKLVRERRAACRACRRCETCLNRDGRRPYACDTCSRSPYGSDNWEPRKEASND